jgi:hypothetical protein
LLEGLGRDLGDFGTHAMLLSLHSGQRCLQLTLLCAEGDNTRGRSGPGIQLRAQGLGRGGLTLIQEPVGQLTKSHI